MMEMSSVVLATQTKRSQVIALLKNLVYPRYGVVPVVTSVEVAFGLFQLHCLAFSNECTSNDFCLE